MKTVLRSTIVCVCLIQNAVAQLDYEQEPINYSTSQATDPVARLLERLDSGETRLNWDDDHGYLKSVLKELQVPVSSQVLVFSKTSLQVSRITPRTPRAIYFNDDVYVGWVQRGGVVELSAADARLGGTFYTLEQTPGDRPRIERETAHCLQCHGSTHTRRTPGHMVRSVYSDAGGLPVYRLGTFLNDDTSPFENRWGGWYVTGTHGSMSHMGNVVMDQDGEVEDFDRESGANITRLSDLVNTKPYLSDHSDIVALMVLQHQTTFHNVLTAANHSGLITARDAIIMNKALGRPEDHESESTERRYSSAAEKVLKGLLFSNEWPLQDTVKGTTSFVEDFQSRGPFDSQNRSLRQFDLKTRLFRYPCSFLIYSDGFTNLPPGVRNRIWSRLDEILDSRDVSPAFSHLSPEDRQAIREILIDTCPEFRSRQPGLNTENLTP
ncbi:MAG: hypothetical protein R3C20_16040 [Planctomycetaceae bacterium]